MEFNLNNYLLENFPESDANKIRIKQNKNSKNIEYPVLKKKIIKNIISSFYDETDLFQIRSSFYEYITDLNNIQNILNKIHLILKHNVHIFTSNMNIQNNLIEISEQKNILFKFSYFNKVFTGSNPLELYFYHNCFVIYLYLCNKIKLSLHATVFDKTIANAAAESLNTMISFIYKS